MSQLVVASKAGRPFRRSSRPLGRRPYDHPSLIDFGL
jgi:nuclear transport factor 2 (NTF2) superfamily protein